MATTKMKPTVYLDATIPSYYYEHRRGSVNQAWRQITAEFWESGRHDYEVFVSDEVVRELEDEGYPEEKRIRCLALIDGLPRLETTDEVTELAIYYAREGAMPSEDMGDAFHLAIATSYRIQYLLTWNCKHLANANKFRHIQVLSARRQLVPPLIVTSAQLLGIQP